MKTVTHTHTKTAWITSRITILFAALNKRREKKTQKERKNRSLSIQIAYPSRQCIKYTKASNKTQNVKNENFGFESIVTDPKRNNKKNKQT